MTIDDTNMIDPPAGTYSDLWPPCECGHAAERHNDWGACTRCPGCAAYEAIDPEAEAEERWEAALEARAEERARWR